MSPRLSDLFLSSQSDERLVGLARAGHERAFAVIVERYRPELYALARRLCSDGRGEDVVQQAFLSAFAALRSGAEIKHLRGWLYQIVRNAATRSRSPLCVPLDGETACVESVEDIVQQRAQAMSALSELARLPARQRQAMVGTALDGMARADVASTMGVSEGAVRQLVHRARASLRTAVTALTPWPLARWFAAVRPGGLSAAEMATGAGTASSGAVALKVGALLASGTLLTGVAAVDLHPAPARRSGARAAASTRTQPRSGAAPAHELAVALPATPRAVATVFPRAAGRQIAGSRRGAARIGETGVRFERGGAQRENSTTRDERGEANQPNGGDRSSPAGTGSGSHVDGAGRDGGSRQDGSGGSSGGPSGSVAAASGSGDRHADAGAGSHTLDSAVDGQSSGGGAGSGSGSGERSAGGLTSGDGSGSGSVSVSVSVSGSGSGSDSSTGDGGAITGH